MLEYETDLIVNTIKTRTISGNTVVAVKDILAAEIPAQIKVFFRADVELMLLDELQDHWKTSRFQFNRPDVQNIQQQANAILLLHYTFDRSEYLHRLEDVVHMTANFLIRPQWTMKNVLFEREETVTTKALLRHLRYFGSYEYLRDMIIRYVQSKNLSSFRQEDFSSFLWRADGAYLRRKSGDELARVLSPMYQFFEYPAHGNDFALPAAALIKFFDDKGLAPVSVRLEGEIAQNKIAFSQRELGFLLGQINQSAGAFVVDRPEHLLKTQASLPNVLAPEPANETMSGTATMTRPTLTVLSELIEEPDRKKFIKRLFQQDPLSFQTAIKLIDGIATWKEASRCIDELFIEHDVDPYSPEAVRFHDIVFQRFHPHSN